MGRTMSGLTSVRGRQRRSCGCPPGIGLGVSITGTASRIFLWTCLDAEKNRKRNIVDLGEGAQAPSFFVCRDKRLFSADVIYPVHSGPSCADPVHDALGNGHDERVDLRRAESA